MSMEKLNAAVGQSGGPTAAINATLAGVIRGALESEAIKTIYGMRNGIEGFLREDFVDLNAFFDTEDKIRTLENTPAAALGSCRKRLKKHSEDSETYARILEILKKYDIRYFFYIGGNDSMDTVLKLSEYAKENDYEIRVIGVPKTIDNDLVATDHTPGFGSAAKFVATTVKEILRDVSVYTVKAVTIIEIMGRDAGWLTASAALPFISGGQGPDLVYLPEKAFDIDRFIEDVKSAMDKHPAVLVAVSEGVRLQDGRYVGEAGTGAVDAFGHTQLSGASKVLEGIVKNRLGCKVRSVELNLPQRCASHIASLQDITESVATGRYAVRMAEEGRCAVMITIERDEGENYSFHNSTADIATIANAVKGVPDEYINEEANGITDMGLKYLAPLVLGEVYPEYENGMPKHIVI